MFIGFYLHTLDKKNRIFLPSKFRDKKSEFVISRGFEHCLYLFDKNSWIKILNKFDTVSWSDKAEQRAFKRILLAGAIEVKVDTLGRILLPSHLIDYACIKKTVVIIGMGDRVEIWDEKRWKDYSSGFAEKAFSSLSDKLDL